MCLAIYKPKGKQIKKAYLENGYNGNNDGCGYCYANKGQFHVERGFKSFDAFWQSISKVMNKQALLVHFRLATHGDKTERNMHPFIIGNGQYAVIHNGILNIKATGNDSDTSVYAQKVLAPLYERFAFNDSVVEYLVETSIGSGNKIVVMRYDGKVMIYNESQGHWHKGIWYSNHGYEFERSFTSIAYGSYCKTNWKREPSAVVFDEDEAAAEAIAQYVPDAETGQSGFPDFVPNPANETYADYWKRMLPAHYSDNGK